MCLHACICARQFEVFMLFRQQKHQADITLHTEKKNLKKKNVQYKNTATTKQNRTLQMVYSRLQLLISSVNLWFAICSAISHSSFCKSFRIYKAVEEYILSNPYKFVVFFMSPARIRKLSIE